MKNRRRLKGTGIGIEEDLTSTNRALLKEAKEEANKNDKLIAAWYVDGKVFVSMKTGNGTSAKKKIVSNSDLKKL